MKIDELIFNEKNIEHIARHNVLPEEVKEIFEGKSLFLAAKLGRVMVIGKTQHGRFLSVIIEKVEGNRYFVVTARDADRKERKMYKEELGGEEKSYEKINN